METGKGVRQRFHPFFFPKSFPLIAVVLLWYMILTDLQTLFGYLTPISLTMGVIYHIMTLRTNQRNKEIALKNQELSLEAQDMLLRPDKPSSL